MRQTLTHLMNPKVKINTRTVVTISYKCICITRELYLYFENVHNLYY